MTAAACSWQPARRPVLLAPPRALMLTVAVGQMQHEHEPPVSSIQSLRSNAMTYFLEGLGGVTGARLTPMLRSWLGCVVDGWSSVLRSEGV
ncbi:hypothetical protein EJ03DRAFT_329001 [Teratosphaeria nubilosa]|uniref:Uncharacterized protein n=1 Tax=Teratosphaeria nubilosa TaxID=161662 RepID=A0A6G1L4Z9_9PEZI|nr:hypothetical protein EJ03DRAFT_329001 [Teratosphaeria nubilosa]